MTSCLLAALWKMDDWIFMKFLGLVGKHTRNNLEHLGDVVFNPRIQDFRPGSLLAI